MKSKAFFRVDASVKIGIGHVMRCLTVADYLAKSGTQVTFICRDFPGNMGKFIEEKGYTVKLLSATETEYKTEPEDPPHVTWLGVKWCDDAEDTVNAMKHDIADWLIVDHYGIDFRWHGKLRPFVRNIMVIDDLADRRLDCDLLLDQTYKRDKRDYIGLVPDKCKLLVGSDYALLRKKFFLLRNKSLSKKNQIISIRRIHVSVGGMDPDNYISRILSALDKVAWEEIPVVDVVINEYSPHIENIQKQAEACTVKVNIFTNVTDMSDMMFNADLSIGAGGTTTWERCCLGLPQLLLQVAENQKYVIANLVKENAVLRIDENNIEASLKSICESLMINMEKLKRLSMISSNVANGLGAELLVNNLFPEIAKNGEKITLRKVKISDKDTIYAWQKRPETRRYFHDNIIPEYEKHVTWMKKKIFDPECVFLMIECDGIPGGVVRLDYHLQEKGDYYLISIYLSPDKYYMGISTIVLKYIDRMFKGCEIHAEVSASNIASQKLFEKANFIKKNKDGSKEKKYNLYIRKRSDV